MILPFNLNLKQGFVCFVIFIAFLFIIGIAHAERFFQGHSTFYERIPSNPVISVDNVRIMNNFREGGIKNITLTMSIPVYRADSTSVNKNITLTNGTNGTTKDPYDYTWEVNNWGWGTVPLRSTDLPWGNNCRCVGDTVAPGNVPKPYAQQYAACYNNSDQNMTVISQDGTQAWFFHHAYTCDGETFYANSVRMFRSSEDGVGSHNTADGFMGCSFDANGNPVPTPANINQSAHDADRPFDSYGGGGMLNTSRINGILSYAEVANNTIDHTLVYAGRMRENGTSWSHLYPACPDSAINSYDANFVNHPRGGQRFYLNMTEEQIIAYVNAKSWSEAHKRVMRAMRDYGIIFYELTGKSDNFMYLYADGSTSQADWVQLFGGTGTDATAYSFGTGLYKYMVAIDPLKPPF